MKKKYNWRNLVIGCLTAGMLTTAIEIESRNLGWHPSFEWVQLYVSITAKMTIIIVMSMLLTDFITSKLKPLLARKGEGKQ